MEYKECLCYLEDGCTIRSNQCEYKIINDVFNWRYINLKEWIPIINKEELENEWKVIGEDK